MASLEGSRSLEEFMESVGLGEDRIGSVGRETSIWRISNERGSNYDMKYQEKQ